MERPESSKNFRVHVQTDPAIDQIKIKWEKLKATFETTETVETESVPIDFRSKTTNRRFASLSIRRRILEELDKEVKNADDAWDAAKALDTIARNVIVELQYELPAAMQEMEDQSLRRGRVPWNDTHKPVVSEKAWKAAEKLLKECVDFFRNGLGIMTPSTVLRTKDAFERRLKIYLPEAEEAGIQETA